MNGKFAKLFHKKLQSFLAQGLGFSNNPKLWPEQWKQVQFKTYPRASCIQLPKPNTLPNNLSEVLEDRTSTRDFEGREEITPETLSTLLHYTVGINQKRKATSDKNSVRHYPSGGALYPLEIYLYIQSVTNIPEGLYHYNVQKHNLEHIGDTSYKEELFSGLYTWAQKAQLTIITTSVWERNFQKYKDYGYQIVLLESGHLAQNIQLVAQSLGLHYCSYVGFDAEKLDSALDIKEADQETSIYVTSVGI